MKKKMVMVFGVFDRLHPGHWAFLRQTKKHGGKLVVVVARDSAARKLKKKIPQQNERQRMEALRKIRAVSKVILGDSKQSSYLVIKRYKPDIICFGYDQKWLANDLRKRMSAGLIPRVKTVRLKAYKPQKYHSSILRGDAA